MTDVLRLLGKHVGIFICKTQAVSHNRNWDWDLGILASTPPVLFTIPSACWRPTCSPSQLKLFTAGCFLHTYLFSSSITGHVGAIVLRIIVLLKKLRTWNQSSWKPTPWRGWKCWYVVSASSWLWHLQVQASPTNGPACDHTWTRTRPQNLSHNVQALLCPVPDVLQTHSTNSLWACCHFCE